MFRTAVNPIAESTLGGRTPVYSLKQTLRYQTKPAPTAWEFRRPDAVTRLHDPAPPVFPPYVLDEELLGAAAPEVPPEADFQPEEKRQPDERDDDRLAVFDYLGV